MERQHDTAEANIKKIKECILQHGIHSTTVLRALCQLDMEGYYGKKTKGCVDVDNINVK